MKRLFLFLFLVSSFSSIFSCSIYKSADRNNFESEVPTFKIKSLQKQTCSAQSIASEASQSRLLTAIDDEFLWEHQIQQNSFYESTDLKGTYCLYDVTFE
ncbi:hypothetical protein [Pseudobdellovibrio sp. HCB154]|uniref:hypothetical protein n=1 Tax=Pseudobdellovibrio sp. HCB154 TaxID=3386277 RepID=UPI00391715AB